MRALTKPLKEFGSFLSGKIGSKFRSPVEIVRRSVKYGIDKRRGKTDKTFKEAVLKSGYSIFA